LSPNPLFLLIMGSEIQNRLLIKKFIEGDVHSFDQLYYAYDRKVYSFALSFLKNKSEAEEVTQEVFMNLWRFRGQIDENQDFNSYLFKIAYNAVCKVFRKKASQRRQAEHIVKNYILEDTSTDLEIEYRNLMDILDKLVEELPPQQKAVFLMKTKDNLENEQIANALGITLKTVENHFSNAKNYIKKFLTNQRLISVLFFWLFVK